MKKKDDGKLAQDVSMAETLDTLGAKINELSASVDRRFEDVDKRIEDGFTAAAVQFAEQGAYTEFAYARLEKDDDRPLRFPRAQAGSGPRHPPHATKAKKSVASP